ncbi:transposase-like protein [Roseospira visakhapatnamensis]|uniref:Mutator family transposase n=1 Tax=Roseospira visakhapatnamensis TaxID=390880 RepID=A0A7W6RED4_9PROT|nr:transposase-like protein [Roseospira visakhapatnamensis]
MEDEKPCILVVIGATPEGRKDLVGVQAGFRESTQNWRELLNDLKGRGLSNGPDLAVGDGALGFWTAIDDVFPGARHQRCWVHNTANVLNKVPKSKQKAAKDDLHAIWMAEGRAEAEKGDGHLQSQVATCSSASRHCAR